MGPPIALFVYGSLLDPAVLKRELRRPPPRGAPGTVTGYRRLALRGVDYPALQPHPQGRTRGLLLRISRRDLHRLDRYEGSEYIRRRLRVQLDDGASALAEVYLLTR